MELPGPLVEGTLLRRYKRFLADVRLADGREVTAHCPNPGSMVSCMREGGRVLLSDHQGSKRRLRYGWELSRMGETWVLVNTARANHVVREAVEAGRVPELRGYAGLRAEVPYGERSRVDFLLEDPARPPCYLEVKQATLEHQGVSYFPDSVTARGTRHLRELVARVEVGARAVLLFLVARGDTARVRPAARIDPVYAAGLRAAVEAGLEVLAYRAQVLPTAVELGARLPVELDPGHDEDGPAPRR